MQSIYVCGDATVARMTTSGKAAGFGGSMGNEIIFNKGAALKDGRTKNSEDWVNMCLNTLQSRG